MVHGNIFIIERKKLMTSAEKTQGISFFDMDPAVTVGILDPLSLFSR